MLGHEGRGEAMAERNAVSTAGGRERHAVERDDSGCARAVLGAGDATGSSVVMIRGVLGRGQLRRARLRGGAETRPRRRDVAKRQQRQKQNQQGSFEQPNHVRCHLGLRNLRDRSLRRAGAPPVNMAQDL